MSTFIATEYAEQCAFVEYLDILKKQKRIVMYTAIPNGTFTKSWSQKRRNKAMGVRPGFPDMVVLLKNKMVLIELKRVKGGVVSECQQSWIQELQKSGIPAKVCKGFIEAKEFLLQNLI